MVRLGIIELIFLAIPFAIYFAYRTFLRRHLLEEGEAFSPVPYHKLFVAGGVLSLLVFLVLAFTGDKSKDGKYVPAHMENGELVPGGFVEEEQSKEPEPAKK